MSGSLLKSTRNRLIFTGSWLIWTLIHFKLIHAWEVPVGYAIVDAIFSNGFLALACIMVTNMFRYYRPHKGRYVYVLVISLAVSGLWVAIVGFGLKMILQNNSTYNAVLAGSMGVRYNIAFLVIVSMVLISVLWHSLEEQKENEARRDEAKKLAKEAELFKLRQQLQPHFLFNSLNSISALINSRPEQARQMIHQLSDFLRGTLKQEDDQFITLKEELQYLQLYLDIEKVRFGHRLETDLKSSEKADEMKLPALILQPLVENAIKFGLYDTIGDIMIRINAMDVENVLVITVENPFDPETSNPRQGTGFGLNSARRRLNLLFARNDLLTTGASNNIYTTTVKIPQS